jgi:RNase adaptor protein for sRNA GlmZ degradation
MKFCVIINVDLMSIKIFTGGSETKFPEIADLTFDVADMGMKLFDFNGKTQQIRKHILSQIKTHQANNSKQNFVVIVKCDHGLHRSVETAEWIKQKFDQTNVTLTHLEFTLQPSTL